MLRDTNLKEPPLSLREFFKSLSEDREQAKRLARRVRHRLQEVGRGVWTIASGASMGAEGGVEMGLAKALDGLWEIKSALHHEGIRSKLWYKPLLALQVGKRLVLQSAEQYTATFQQIFEYLRSQGIGNKADRETLHYGMLQEVLSLHAQSQVPAVRTCCAQILQACHEDKIWMRDARIRVATEEAMKEIQANAMRKISGEVYRGVQASMRQEEVPAQLSHVHKDVQATRSTLEQLQSEQKKGRDTVLEQVKNGQLKTEESIRKALERHYKALEEKFQQQDGRLRAFMLSQFKVTRQFLSAILVQEVNMTEQKGEQKRTPMPLSKARARLLKAKRRVHQSIQKELKGANELGLERRLSGENSMQIGMYYDKIGAAWAADIHYSVAQTTYKAAKGHFVYALDKISNSDGGEVFQGSALQKTLEKNLAELEQTIEQLEKHLEARKGSVPPLPSSTPLALLE